MQVYLLAINLLQDLRQSFHIIYLKFRIQLICYIGLACSSSWYQFLDKKQSKNLLARQSSCILGLHCLCFCLCCIEMYSVGSRKATNAY